MSLKDYYDILGLEKYLKERKINIKRELNKEFYKEHKKTFIFLDVLFVFIILFNFGAVCITNYLVAEKEIQTEGKLIVQEVNPVASQVLGIEQHPDYKKILWGILKFMVLWYIFIAVYLHLRRNVISHKGLSALYLLIVIYFFILGYDFFNDLGFYLAKIFVG